MKSLLLVLTTVFISSALSAQNISINTTGAANSTLSMLELLQISTTANSKGLHIAHSGAPTGIAYGIWSEVTGASTTNIGGYFNVSGATNNYAGIFTGGDVGIGISTPSVTLHVKSPISTATSNNHPFRVAAMIEGDNSTFGGRLAIRQFGNNSSLTLFRSNGTMASPTALNTNDIMGMISFGGYDGSVTNSFFGLYAVAAENWTASAHGSHLIMNTIGMGGGYTGTERMRITSEGDVGIGTAAPIAKLHTTATYTVDATAYGMYNWITSTPSLSGTVTHFGFQNNLLFRPTENGNNARGYAVYNRVYTDGSYTFQHLRGAMNLAYSNSTAASDQDNIVGSYNQGYNNSTGVVTNVYGAYNEGINNENAVGTGSVTAQYGSYNRAYVNAGTTNNAFGAYNYALKNTTGNIATAYGSYNRVRNTDATGTGSITTAYGVFSQVDKNAAGNDYTTTYGLFANLAAGATRWGVYTQNEDKNYFSGSVGIGTTTPPTKLSVYVTGSTDGITLDGTTYPQMVFKENGTVRAQLGIPTTAGGYDPAAVVGDIVFRTTGGKLIFATNGGVGTAALTILGANGNVGIGTTSPGYKLEVNGRLKTTGINETSDQRMKTNVSTIEHALKSVKEMRGVKFNWDTVSFPDKKFESTRQIGLIAQEVEKVFPELVKTGSDGYKSIEYSKLVAVLIEALKEQSVIIGDQDKLISSMRSEITSMRGEMDSIRQLVENALELKINLSDQSHSLHK